MLQKVIKYVQLYAIVIAPPLQTFLAALVAAEAIAMNAQVTIVLAVIMAVVSASQSAANAAVDGYKRYMQMPENDRRMSI